MSKRMIVVLALTCIFSVGIAALPPLQEGNSNPVAAAFQPQEAEAALPLVPLAWWVVRAAIQAAGYWGANRWLKNRGYGECRIPTLFCAKTVYSY